MTDYFLRLRNAVDAIYRCTSGNVPYRGSISKIGKADLYRKCAKALINKGYLVKYGTVESPVYKWNGKNLEEVTYHEVFHWIRNYNKQWYSHVPEEQKQEKSEIKPLDATAKDELKSVKVNETSTAVTLTDFTDAELWEELKRRNYTIKDDKLVKVSYTWLN